MILQSNQVICRNNSEILFSGAVSCPEFDSVNVFGIIISKCEEPNDESDASYHLSTREIMVSLGVIANDKIRSMSDEGQCFLVNELVDAINEELPFEWSAAYSTPDVTIWKNHDSVFCEDCFFDLVNRFYINACLNELESRCISAEDNQFSRQCLN